MDLADLRQSLRSDIAKEDGLIEVPDDIIAEVVDRSIGRMVADLNGRQRETVRRLVARAYDQGWQQGELADRINMVVGLDVPRLNAVENYRQSLSDQGVPRGIARRRAKALADRLRANRANTIAQTELANLVGDAKRLAWERAKEDGKIDQYAVRIWHTHRDERMCKTCRPMNGKRAAVGRTYKTGVPQGPPAHPNCRCWETLERGPELLGKSELGSDFKYRELTGR